MVPRFSLLNIAMRLASGLKSLSPSSVKMQGKGYSMRRMATELTKRKVKTPRGGTWHPQTVKMVMQRLAS